MKEFARLIIIKYISVTICYLPHYKKIKEIISVENLKSYLIENCLILYFQPVRKQGQKFVHQNVSQGCNLIKRF